jgi:hypothetical protein
MAYPDYYEEKGTRKLTFNRRGAFGTKTWIAKWEYRFLAAPLLDTPYSLGYPRIRCNECNFEPFGATGDGHAITIANGLGGTVPDTYDYEYCRITAQYEYDVLTGDEPQVSGDCTVDILNIGQGRNWTNALKPTLHTPCPIEEPTPVMIPTLSLTYRVVQRDVPLPAIFACTGRVNGTIWGNAQPGTMLYEGATWDSDYDAQTGALRYIVQHRFRWRVFSWQYSWRPAHQQQGADGTPVNDADGFPVYDILATWDTPNPALYETSNFSILGLGI